MDRKLKKKILYAPLFTGMMLASISAVQSQETAIDFKSKITELESRISGLELLKQELQDLKKNLEEREKIIVVKEGRLDTEIKSIKSLRKTLSVKEAQPDARWHVTGYADVGFEAISGDAKDSFVTGKFNPVFHFQYKDWVLFESELELETTDDGATGLTLEYSQIDFLLHDNVTLVVGKFLSPIGQFMERLHPSWINKSVDMPAGFGHGGVQPTSDTGFMLRGGVPVNDFIFTYAVAVGNGPRFGHGEDELELEGFGKDNDKNKSFGGRLALVHKSSLEVGVSYLNSGLNSEGGLQPDGDIELARKADYRLWGADMAYSKGSWDVRAEYLNSKSTPVAIDGEVLNGAVPATWETWYTQVAYRLSGISDNRTLGKFEPLVRYGEFRVKVEDIIQMASEKRWNVGLNYWLAPSIAVKTSIERRNYMVASRTDDTRFQLQFAYGF